MSIEKIDTDFLNFAEKCTSFKLNVSNFQKKENKEEIRHLFLKHWFPKLHVKFLKANILSEPIINRINTQIKKLKNNNKSGFEQLHKYPLKGVGPAEITMYFLIDDAVLGGGSSAGLDLILGNNGYEIKSVEYGSKYKIANKNFLSGFKLGGTFSLASVMKDIQKLHGKSINEIAGSIINGYRESGKLSKIENEFREIAYDRYFSKHPIIFVKNKGSGFGEIICAMKVKKEDIFIDVMTSGTIKPMILF